MLIQYKLIAVNVYMHFSESEIDGNLYLYTRQKPPVGKQMEERSAGQEPQLVQRRSRKNLLQDFSLQM